MNKEINGIICEVKNCKFHSIDNNCHAGHIRVGDRAATSSCDTSCETFECCDTCECSK
ncbi:MAG: DUF1540 domain-containing protein [Acetobacter sp.]|nr:DUF1540 domain-containing protein [Bacteroides sp.]MCM1341407.1 DUF1540 domain-containing protein [Acetobacter sp.]MCM1433361.1 DUF1540 domain-containing protein [Clostridiales bacterium]